MIVWLCEGCIKERGGPARIGEDLSMAQLFGRCSDCGAAWCLWCRSPEESKERGHRGCPVAAAGSLAASRPRAFQLPEVDQEAPTVRDVGATAAPAPGARVRVTLRRGRAHVGTVRAVLGEMLLVALDGDEHTDPGTLVEVEADALAAAPEEWDHRWDLA